MILLMVCYIMTTVICPPDKWWGHITYIVTWPDHLGQWIRKNFEKGE